MDLQTAAQVAAAATVAFVLAGAVVTGPLVGFVALDPPPEQSLGDGTATVSSVAIAEKEFRITPGRFGTDVPYLRIPDAEVDVDSISGRSRLVYRVRVPALDLQRIATEHLSPGDEGSHRLRASDRALDPDRDLGGSYRGIVTVKVQSHADSETVYNRTVTVRGDT